MKKPKYQEIIDDLIKSINDGILEAGMKLPSQRVLAEKYEVNRTTIIHVLEILKSKGILETKERKGIYVADNQWNTYIQNNISWQSYIGNNASKNNQYYIQEINRCEFIEGIQRLGTGELSPRLIPNEILKNIITEDNRNHLTTNYEEPKGNIHLRNQIKEFMSKRGIECNIEEICVTSGALQGLKLISDGLLTPQSKILVETPSYINSIRTWHAIQSKLIALPIEYIKNNINAIFKEDEDYSNSILYCNPTLHNPTSNTYTVIEKNKLLEQSKEKGIPIVEDDIYSELWFGNNIPKSLKQLDKNNNVIYIGSLSKTVSPGLRIGWIIGNENVIEHLADLKMQNDYGASSVSQFIAARWLESYHEAHIDSLKTALLKRKNIMCEVLYKYFSDIGYWDEPQGSFYIWFKFRKKINMKKLFQLALEENILINPGEIYSNSDKGKIRFSYSYIDEEMIEPSIKRLREIIDRERLMEYHK